MPTMFGIFMSSINFRHTPGTANVYQKQKIHFICYESTFLAHKNYVVLWWGILGNKFYSSEKSISLVTQFCLTTKLEYRAGEL